MQVAEHVDGIDAALESGIGGGEPDFVSARGPSQALFAFPTCGEITLVTCEIYDCNGAAVVFFVGVVEKGDLIAFGRDAGMADPAGGFIEDVADGKFKPLPARRVANNGEGFSIGGPIGPVNILGNLARRTAR